MFMRNIALCVIILCVVSLCVGLPFAEAHHGTDVENEELKTAEINRDTAYDKKADLYRAYNNATRVVSTLLGEWNANEDAIKDETWDLANTGAATVIAELIRLTNTNDDTRGTEMVIEALPSMLTALNAGRSSAALIKNAVKRDKYLSALSAAFGALDAIVSANQAAFDFYEREYDVYVDKMQNHGGGLARVANHSSSGDYTSVTALSLATIKSTIKAKDAFNETDSLNMLKYWYHIRAVDDKGRGVGLHNTSKPSKTSFRGFKNFESSWKFEPFPTNQRCGGDCGLTHRSPAEQLLICKVSLSLSADSKLPAGKNTPAGCNKGFYSCSSADIDEHKVRICAKKNKNDQACQEPYRNCNNPWYPHKVFSLIIKTPHKAGGLTPNPTTGFAPSSGSYTASAGSTHTGTVTAPSIYGANLYVNGSSAGWFSGSTTATSLSLSYTFPSNASGSYTMRAEVYPWNGSTSGTPTDYSYTVTIGSTTPTTPSTPTTSTYHACGVHETTVSGSHSAAGCGKSGHYACDGSSHASAVCGTTGHYNCDNRNHSMQVTCTTHSTCDVTNFYACDNHDPAVTCANGHSYNPSNRGEYNRHRTRTCRWCTQTWQKCVSEAPQCLVKTKRTCWAIQ